MRIESGAAMSLASGGAANADCSGAASFEGQAAVSTECGPIRIGTFSYVSETALATFHREGWMVVGFLGWLHSETYRSLLMWHCDCGEEEQSP